MTVALSILVFLVAAILVILLAIRLDRYEAELERRFRLRTLGARGGDPEYGGAARILGTDDRRTRRAN